MGLYEPDDKRITLSPDQSWPSLVHTAAHELAHIYDPWRKALTLEDYRRAPASYEAVAALVAQQVCSRVGLDADRRTNAYLEHWMRRSASRSKSDPALRTGHWSRPLHSWTASACRRPKDTAIRSLEHSDASSDA